MLAAASLPLVPMVPGSPLSPLVPDSPGAPWIPIGPSAAEPHAASHATASNQDAFFTARGVTESPAADKCSLAALGDHQVRGAADVEVAEAEGERLLRAGRP